MADDITLDLGPVMEALRAKEWKLALEKVEPLLLRYPQVGRLWSIRAQIALEAGEVMAARRYALYALASRDETMALDLLASACLRAADVQAAYEASVIRAGMLPEDMNAAVRAGNIAHEAQLAAASLEWFAEAARRDPDHAQPWTNRGFVLKFHGDFRGALEAYDEGVRRAPTDPDLRWNRSQCLLACGRFAEGLQEAEWRWKKESFPSKPRGFQQPLWMGGYVGTLLIHAEQGFGDCIQMLRYVPFAAKRVGRVVLEMQPELYRLVKAQAEEGRLLQGMVSVIVQGKDALPPFDAHVPMMTLPLSLGLFDLARPPLPQAYLYSPAGIEFQDAGAPGSPLLNVGFCWRGRPTFPHNHMRSFSLDDMAPLFTLPAVRWLSLQKTSGVDGAAELREAGVTAIDLGGHAQDFQDTASYLKSLDLFITTDTSVAHLAGALGVETWVAVMAIPDWRWVPGGDKCVWYDSVQIFRQNTAGDWTPVFAAIREMLANRLADKLLREALRCETLQDHAGAARYYREILGIKPELGSVWNNLGNTCQAQGKKEEALACYRQALDAEPNCAPVLDNAGNALVKLGLPEQAIGCLLKAIELEPTLASAHNNLGVAYEALGRLDDALAAYREAFHLQPHSALTLNNQGGVLMKLGMPEQAAASFKHAIEIEPEAANFFNNLGGAYLELGETESATMCFEEAIRLKPDYGEAYRHMVMTVKYRERDQHIEYMERLYGGGSLSDEQRIHLSFALGKVYEDLKEYEKAFGYILEGNRLKRATYQYAPVEDVAYFARIKQVFSASYFAQQERMGCLDPTPVFVLGMPRSGTSLVEQILASHPKVFGAGEIVDLSIAISEGCRSIGGSSFPDGVAAWTHQEYQRVAEYYGERLQRRSSGALLVTDKLPENFLRLGLIHVLFPNAKVIHCRRNPLDTCLSIFKNFFTGDLRFAYDLQELGQYYKLYQDLMAYWRDLLPACMYEIDYESLIADQEVQTKRLLEYCGLEWDAACLSFYASRRGIGTASVMQVRQPMYRDSIGLSRQYGGQLHPLIQALA